MFGKKLKEKITALEEQLKAANHENEQLEYGIRKMASDVEALAVAAVAGKLDTRADASKHQGDFQKIVKGVNETLDAVIGPFERCGELCRPYQQG